jgi:hypothetical protein
MKMTSALFLDCTEAANMKLFIELILDVIIPIAVMMTVVFVMYSAKNKCEDLHNVSDCHWIYVPVEIEKE